jgi:membrane protein
MASQWQFGGLSPFDLAARVWARMGKDDVSGRAAELAYYFFLAVFPLLFFLLSLLGFFAAAGAELRSTLLNSLARMVPSDASGLISKTITQVIAARGTGKIVIGLLGALWAASSGVSSLIETLNIAYEVEESRPFWKKRAIAVGLTAAVSVFSHFGGDPTPLRWQVGRPSGHAFRAGGGSGLVVEDRTVANSIGYDVRSFCTGVLLRAER